jgi:hypothetical protein
MVDAFRNNFFDKLINEQKEKERQIKIFQKKCFHNYITTKTDSTYQERICSKCDHSAIKNVKVWNGTKNGSCIIA